MKKAMSQAVSVLAGAGVGATVIGRVQAKKIKSWHEKSDKHLALFKMMNQWVRVKQEGKNLSEYFEANHYHNIAIYGMSYAGATLVEELKGTNITIKYGIDNKANNIYSEIEIVTMDTPLDEVDAIVVTAITFFDKIAEKLEQKVDCPIVSLEDILYEV